MKITIESTERVVEISNDAGVVRARVWQGATEAGIPVYCLVANVAVREGLPDSAYREFDADLQSHATPSTDAVRAFDLRMIL